MSHGSFAEEKERWLWVALFLSHCYRFSEVSRHPSNKKKHAPWVAPPVFLTNWGMGGMWSKRGCDFPGVGDDAACTRVICCEVLNLNTPALGETTIPGYLAFALEMAEKFPTISIKVAKSSRNKWFCQSNNFYNYSLGVLALAILPLPPTL